MLDKCGVKPAMGCDLPKGHTGPHKRGWWQWISLSKPRAEWRPLLEELQAQVDEEARKAKEARA